MKDIKYRHFEQSIFRQESGHPKKLVKKFPMQMTFLDERGTIWEWDKYDRYFICFGGVLFVDETKENKKPYVKIRKKDYETDKKVKEAIRILKQTNVLPKVISSLTKSLYD